MGIEFHAENTEDAEASSICYGAVVLPSFFVSAVLSVLELSFRFGPRATVKLRVKEEISRVLESGHVWR